MAAGMFDALMKGQRQEEVDEQNRLRFMAQNPANARALAAYESADMAGRGLGNAVAGAAGKDTRTSDERLQNAMAAIGEMPETDMTKPEGVDTYYKGVINVLRQHGLPAEAHRAAQEWNDYKSKDADRQYKIDDMKRKKEEADRKAGIAEEANRIKAARNQQLAQQGMPEFIQVVDRIEKESNPVQRKLMMDRANQMAGGKVVLEDAGDRVIVRNQRGELLGIDEVGEKPMNEKDRRKDEDKKKALGPAYQAAMLALQTQYKAAADLFNGPGLDDLIGKWTGLAAQYGEKDGMLTEAAVARLSPAGQEALGVYQQIIGGAFINALKQLKEAGGGSTGLGQVTEAEGKRITTAGGALFPRQQPASFRRKLADYIDTIEQSAEIIRGKAQSEGLTPIDLTVVPLSGPTRGQAAAPASTRPSPRNPAPAAGGGDMVSVRRKSDGKAGKIPRSNFNTDKYEEIK